MALPQRARVGTEYSALTTMRSLIRPRTCNTSPGRICPWIGFNWRYDSGLVAGECRAPEELVNGQGTIRRGCLRPDSRPAVSGGTLLRERFCYAVQRLLVRLRGPNLCPGSHYGSKYMKIPAPGTENDDHNPPRIAPRNLFDLAVATTIFSMATDSVGARASRSSTWPIRRHYTIFSPPSAGRIT